MGEYWFYQGNLEKGDTVYLTQDLRVGGSAFLRRRKYKTIPKGTQAVIVDKDKQWGVNFQYTILSLNGDTLFHVPEHYLGREYS